MGGYKKEGVLVLITQRGGGGVTMGVLDHTIPLFIMFARNEPGDLPHEITANLYCRATKKKKSNCGDDTNAEGPKTTTAGLLNQLNGIALSNVACTSLRILQGLR